MKRQRTLATGSAASSAATTWRPADEAWAALCWLGCAALAALTLLSRPAPGPALILSLAYLCGIWRGRQACRALTDRAALAGKALSFERRAAFAARVRPLLGRDRRWLGYGFDWTPEHAQKLYELSKIDSRRLIPARPLARCLRRGRPKDPEAIGWAALHGVQSWETDLSVERRTLEGGTLIVGTTQSGKGVMMGALITQAILAGDTVIILDPKNSRRLFDAVRGATGLARRPPPLTLDPLSPDGVRLNPLAHYSRPSELAGRITAVIAEEGPFKSFAWSAVHTIASLIDYAGGELSLRAIRETLELGPEKALFQAMTREMGAARLDLMVNEARRRGMKGRELVLAVLAEREKAGFNADVINAATAVYRHDPQHYAKITASLMPVLQMLTSGPLLETLSPGAGGTPEDGRPELTLSSLVADGGVLYVALDSLPDPVLAGAVGSIILADLASLAGQRYRQRAKPARISLFVDECANVIGRPLIEILNKGAESGLQVTCAMQTISDLAARLGNDAEARMALGNFNNVIALRTKDRATQDFIAESFGRTYIAGTDLTLSTSSRGESADRFAAAVSRRMVQSRAELIPPDMLGRLPNCEYFASLAGGRLVKGRVCVLSDGPGSRS